MDEAFGVDTYQFGGIGASQHRCARAVYEREFTIRHDHHRIGINFDDVTVTFFAFPNGLLDPFAHDDLVIQLDFPFLKNIHQFVQVLSNLANFIAGQNWRP